MRNQLTAGFLLVVVVCATAAVVPTVAFGQSIWIGGGGDNLWSNPDNWAFEVPTAQIRAIVNGPDATAPNGPLIEDGIEAVTELLIGEEGFTSMTMTGGSLELTGWGMWWADSNNVTATFDISGGVINYTGSPGIMEMAWQEAEAPLGSSNAIWNMTGGEINTLGVDMPAKGNGGIATINLDGGTINVGTARDGLKMYNGGMIDITEGQLILEGEQPQVDDYIQDGWIVAYGGDGQLLDEFDGTFRTISATSAALCGDFDMDGDVDVADRTIQTQNWTGAGNVPDPPKTFEQGDCDGDGDVDVADQTGTIQNWTGALMAGNVEDGDDADLIYDAGTGKVTLDARDTASGRILSFVIGTEQNDLRTENLMEPFIDVGTNTDNTRFQMGQTDPLNQGQGPTIELGEILPAGIGSVEELEAYLSLAEYASDLGAGGTLDLIHIPEPSAATLGMLGLLVFCRRRSVIRR